MRASVVVPTYERPDKLEETVASVTDQTVDDYEIIIVDDGSESEQQKNVLNEISEYSRVKIIYQDNSGPAAARNNGWQHASGEFILFTDDDCIVPESWVESMIEAFEDGIAAVGGPLIPRSELLARNRFARAHLFRDEMDYESPQKPTVGHEGLNVGGTANVAYRRAVLAEVGGFDESFPLAAGEDADFQKRVLDAGYRMKYIPTTVRHNDEYDWNSFVSRAIRSGEGTYYFHNKYGEDRTTFRILFGLLGSLIYFPIALARSAEVDTAVLYVIERMLNRWGELRAKFDATL